MPLGSQDNKAHHLKRNYQNQKFPSVQTQEEMVENSMVWKVPLGSTPAIERDPVGDPSTEMEGVDEETLSPERRIPYETSRTISGRYECATGKGPRNTSKAVQEIEFKDTDFDTEYIFKHDGETACLARRGLALGTGTFTARAFCRARRGHA